MTFHFYTKQDRTAEGHSKLKIRKHDKFKRDWFQHWDTCKPKLEQDQVSGGINDHFGMMHVLQCYM